MKQTRKSLARKMRRLVKEWEASNLSQDAFCAQHVLSPAKFKYWRGKYPKEPVSGEYTKAKAIGSAHFVPLQLEAQSNVVTAYHLHFPNGVELRLPPGISSSELATMIRLF